jgi:uncharacterized membrane protein YesL
MTGSIAFTQRKRLCITAQTSRGAAPTIAVVNPKETVAMLSTIVIVLLVLWLLGAFVVPVGGSLIHLLLVIAVIVILIRVIQGRDPVRG